MVGRTLGHYEILEPLGSGGMGDVYRAYDTTLKRDVAVKVLPENLADDPERLARLEREATAIAAIDHPNIVVIYSVEEADSDDGAHLHFITMQLVEGKALSELIPRNGLPLEGFFDLAIPLCDAVSAAHEQGIIHRDLKPANIMVSDDGRVRVLDFGLAKLKEDSYGARGVSFGGSRATAENTEAATEMATVQATRGSSPALTEEGKILGTVAYMSPEQAEGKQVDPRTDVFSLGIILYEMATGRRPFQGDTNVSVISSIVKDTPISVTELNRSLPRHFGRILKRSLEKDVRRRYQTALDIKNDLEDLKEEIVSGELVAEAHVGRETPALWWRGLPWGLTAAIALVSALAVWGPWPTRMPSDGGSAQFSIPLGEQQSFPLGSLFQSAGPTVAISPDGRYLVYVAREGGTQRLYLRPRDQLEATGLRGTEGAVGPFFSPDGNSVGFFTRTGNQRLLTISVLGGEPEVICDVSSPFGATWGEDDTIYFTRWHAPNLWRVSSRGGTPEPVSMVEEGENRPREYLGWPELLPGGRALLLSVVSPGNRRMEMVSLETGEREVLIERGAYARYVPTGHLIYGLAGGLRAVPFDLDGLRITGASVPVLDGVMMEWDDATVLTAGFDVSDAGHIVYIPGRDPAADRILVWVDHDGAEDPLPIPPKTYSHPSISPDGGRIAITLIEQSTRNIWIYDVRRERLSRLTFGDDDLFPLWTSDGERVVFISGRHGPLNVFWIPADGSGEAEQLTHRERPVRATSVLNDGTAIALQTVGDMTTGDDIGLLSLEREKAVTPLLQTQFAEREPRLSPDGRWLAYNSNESGQFEVYVRSFPELDEKWPISTGGGMKPSWSPDGRELFYRDQDRMMAVSFTARPEIEIGRPRLVFEGHYFGENAEEITGRNYDVAKDGERFLMIRESDPESGPDRLVIILNWFEELRRLGSSEQ